MLNVQTGAGREGLPKNKMDEILIPLPPFEEQKVIVKKSRNFNDALRCFRTEQHGNMLMQAVLKEAFEA